MTNQDPTSVFDPPPASDGYAPRHLGAGPGEVDAMLASVGFASLDQLIDATVPQAIRLPAVTEPLKLDPPWSEHALLKRLGAIAAKNRVLRSMIGMGYYDTITPPVILRNIMENPLWYTPYTPYQAEIAQGRLEALLNFQTMVADLTALPLANASLLDEATAAAEAMIMCFNIARSRKRVFCADRDCHPQTLNVLRTRSEALGIELRIEASAQIDFTQQDICGVLVQYPTTHGQVEDYTQLAAGAHEAGALLVVAADLLSLTLLRPPGEFGGDIAIGSTQRFGVPMGYGGPHAAYMSTHEKYARKMPGRIVGVSRDAAGRPALRLAIQTREQHIKRDRATSNICTAQVLLAVLAGMYAVWHGPEGLKRIATRIHAMAVVLAQTLRQRGFDVPGETFFDTIAVKVDSADAMIAKARTAGINLRKIDDATIGISTDQTTSEDDLQTLLNAMTGDGLSDSHDVAFAIPAPLARTSGFLTHQVFNSYHSEHEMLRYITRLQGRDISLAHSMIPLGSCTMKLSAASMMFPVTWQSFALLHPYAPTDQASGYHELFSSLERWLAEITGFAAVSLQPNAGSQGEFAGLLAIARYHRANNQGQRTICVIPTSSHGTNPASAVAAGYQVVAVQCDEQGNIDVEDLRRKAKQHADQLGALMVTYPSTHGVFEESIVEVCNIIHEHGGQVYMDGANMNAQVGLCRPGDIGADVCHLNLHKTFCIPHGGGGPGMGPIGVAAHLEAFLPGDPLGDVHGDSDAFTYPVAAAAYGSPCVLPISWMYIALMGASGLTAATKLAILNANYMAKQLSEHFDVVYTGRNGTVAHEFIIDCRQFEKSADVKVEDIAKRLMDFGFHAPTMSWPVPGTLMIEPTESESKAEMDRMVEALITIRQEIAQIEVGSLDRHDNPLKGAPHTAAEACSDNWAHSYSREIAAFPLAWVKQNKFWPAVARIDNPYGDRNLICTCPTVEEMGAQ